MIRKTIVYFNNNFVNTTSSTVIIRKWLSEIIHFDLRVIRGGHRLSNQNSFFDEQVVTTAILQNCIITFRNMGF